MALTGLEIRLLSDLHARAHREAAELYWLAFSGKLGKLLGPDLRALALLSRAMRPDHALVALDKQERVVGVAGFRTARGGFLVLTKPHLQAVYGQFGGAVRSWLLGALCKDVDTARLLVDGLAVDPALRSQGIGSALMAALVTTARDCGYHGIRLDVSDENKRARALYDRLGFSELSRQQLRLMWPIFGTKGTTAMVLAV